MRWVYPWLWSWSSIGATFEIYNLSCFLTGGENHLTRSLISLRRLHRVISHVDCWLELEI